MGGRINTAVLEHGEQSRRVDMGATFVCGESCPVSKRRSPLPVRPAPHA
jgi:hypothetical protein